MGKSLLKGGKERVLRNGGIGLRREGGMCLKRCGVRILWSIGVMGLKMVCMNDEIMGGIGCLRKWSMERIGDMMWGMSGGVERVWEMGVMG